MNSKYKEAIERWRARISLPSIFAVLLLVYAALDIWRFINTGQSFCHPYLDLLIVLAMIMLLGLTVLSVISIRRREKKENR